MSGDDDVWQHYAKGVKRIRSKKVSAKKKAEKTLTRRASLVLGISSCGTREGGGHHVTDGRVGDVVLDRRVEKAMRSGEIRIEAKLDLHGMRQNEAHEALIRFILTQAERGKRNLLVITGKGGAGGGVLRTNLPRWCGDDVLAGKILALRPAAPKHGGDGAWYVVLRKQK